MAAALVEIKSVTLDKNPVVTGEPFLVSVEVITFDPESPQRRLPLKLGKRKEAG